MDRFRIISKNELEKLPKTTGVYCFTETQTSDVCKTYRCPTLIYIGKALNIQGRVKNHFNQPSYRDNLFIDKVDKIGYFETNFSEIEALILEANLIKKYQPRYNVMWRDDKNYFYIAITQNKNKIPYVFITHQPQAKLNPKPHTLNPVYVGPFVEGAALKKTLRFLRKVFPYYTSAKHPKNKCTYCHLDLCPGPNPNLAEYEKNIKKIILILKGKRNAVLNSLKKEMRNAAMEKKFEEAGKVRDKILALQQVMSHTQVINSEFRLISKIDQLRATSETARKLAEILNVNASIRRIECYDVSNIQGKQATGSMVVFVDGAPDKNLYRKFKIKIENTPNDIAMLKEILQRRFAHPEWKYPEVILIDGGKAQLNAAVNSKSEARNPKQIQNIKVVSIAKGRQELFIENNPSAGSGRRKKPIPLKSLPQEIYNLIKNLDDEAHRFAITYHKTLRKKNLLK